MIYVVRILEEEWWRMSYFGNHEKDDLVDAISEFLENNTVSTLLEVIAYAVYRNENEDS